MHKLYILLLVSFLGFMLNLHAQCNLTATSSGSNPSYIQVYVLVDAVTGNIVAQNSNGIFNAVALGNYRIHALNFDPGNTPAPLPAALIGQPLSLVGSTTTGCLNSDFFTDFVNRSCSSCLAMRTICESDALIVSTSGENAAFTQVYVLVDAATGRIVATNSNGDFTGMVSEGNSYKVHALNFNPLQAPNPMPTVGQALNEIGIISQGCYNSDYLSDFICINLSCLLGNYLINFNGRTEHDKNILFWHVTENAAIQGFVLQRSANGYSDFLDLTFIGSENKSYFEFYDQNPLTQSYYRLKSVFENGETEFSNLVQLNREQSFDINIFPNPAKSKLNIEFYSDSSGDAVVKIYNSLGQELYKSYKNYTIGLNSFTFQFSNFAQGVYLITFETEGKKTVHKIVKE